MGRMDLFSSTCAGHMWRSKSSIVQAAMRDASCLLPKDPDDDARCVTKKREAEAADDRRVQTLARRSSSEAS